MSVSLVEIKSHYSICCSIQDIAWHITESRVGIQGYRVYSKFVATIAWPRESPAWRPRVQVNISNVVLWVRYNGITKVLTSFRRIKKWYIKAYVCVRLLLLIATRKTVKQLYSAKQQFYKISYICSYITTALVFLTYITRPSGLLPMVLIKIILKYMAFTCCGLVTSYAVTTDISINNNQNQFANYLSKFSFKFLRGQWVKLQRFGDIYQKEYVSSIWAQLS